MGQIVMSMIRKCFGALRGLKYWQFKTKCIKVRDYGQTYKILNKNSLLGCGMLVINSNAIDRREYSKLRIDKGGQLIIDGTVSLFVRNNIHIFSDAQLRIGSGTYINEGTKISCKHNIVIGKNCAISNDVSIMDSDFHCIEGQTVQENGVIIGDHVWIGADVSILKNVKIGRDCIIGARTLVTRDVPDHCLAVGNPMRILKKDTNWR